MFSKRTTEEEGEEKQTKRYFVDQYLPIDIRRGEGGFSRFRGRNLIQYQNRILIICNYPSLACSRDEEDDDDKAKNNDVEDFSLARFFDRIGLGERGRERAKACLER